MTTERIKLNTRESDEGEQYFIATKDDEFFTPENTDDEDDQFFTPENTDDDNEGKQYSDDEKYLLDETITPQEYQLLVNFVYAKAHFDGEVIKQPIIDLKGLIAIIRESNILDEKRSVQIRDEVDTIKDKLKLGWDKLKSSDMENYSYRAEGNVKQINKQELLDRLQFYRTGEGWYIPFEKISSANELSLILSAIFG